MIETKNFLVEEDPANTMYTTGKNSMRDYQLLASVIGGNVPAAIQKAKILLNHFQGSLRELAKQKPEQIQAIGGLTKKQATAIVAAFDLGRRLLVQNYPDRPKVSGSRDANEILAPHLADLQHEEFWILMLNKGNQVVRRYQCSVGGTAGTVVDTKLVFQALVVNGAAGFIAAHNHPSGLVQPSQADIALTKRLRTIGEAMDLPLLDHLIIGEKGYYSFADEGMI